MRQVRGAQGRRPDELYGLEFLTAGSEGGRSPRSKPVSPPPWGLPHPLIAQTQTISRSKLDRCFTTAAEASTTGEASLRRRR